MTCSTSAAVVDQRFGRMSAQSRSSRPAWATRRVATAQHPIRYSAYTTSTNFVGAFGGLPSGARSRLQVHGGGTTAGSDRSVVITGGWNAWCRDYGFVWRQWRQSLRRLLARRVLRPDDGDRAARCTTSHDGQSVGQLRPSACSISRPGPPPVAVQTFGQTDRIAVVLSASRMNASSGFTRCPRFTPLPRFGASRAGRQWRAAQPHTLCSQFELCRRHVDATNFAGAFGGLPTRAPNALPGHRLARPCAHTVAAPFTAA